MFRSLLLLGVLLATGCATYQDEVMAHERAQEYTGILREQCKQNPSDCQCQAVR